MANALIQYADGGGSNTLRDAAAGKASKAAVDYGPGMEESHCGICRHFMAPDGCAKVAGRVSPEMWCRLFEAA